MDGADELGLSPKQAAAWRASVRASVDKAPPLSPERMDRVIALLRGGDPANLRPVPRRQPSDAA